LIPLYKQSGISTQLLPLHIGTVGQWNSLANMVQLTGTAQLTSIGWLSANRALYIPVYLPARFTVARFFSVNQNATGNTDIGLYDSGGNRKISTGSTARAGAPAMQYIDVTNQSFPPGMYYLAMVCSSTSSQPLRTTLATNFMRVCGMLQEDLGATTLPTTMTPVTTTWTGGPPLFGFTQSDTL